MGRHSYRGWVVVLLGTGWLAVGATSASSDPGPRIGLGSPKGIRGAPNAAESKEVSLAAVGGLSNGTLIEEYETAGLALRGTHDVPTDEEFSATGLLRDPRNRRFLDVRREIFRRGPEILPVLLDFLRREALTERAPEPGGLRPGLTTDAIELLVAMSNPRASRAPPRTLDEAWFNPQRFQPTMDDPGRLKTAWVLLEIFEGFGGKVKGAKVSTARSALGRLTHCAFLKEESSNGSGACPMDHGMHIVVHRDAINYHLPSSAARAATLYRDWLKNEGSDPARWLPLARHRARELLESDRIYSIYGAAQFLRPLGASVFTPPRRGYDDQPQKTLARLAVVLGQFERGGPRRPGATYYWKGQEAVLGPLAWSQFIMSHGPRARPYVALILHFPECSTHENWGCVEGLGAVGGKRAMEHFVSCVKTSTFETLRYSRLGMDRWAGRCFRDDAERLAWWQAHHDEGEEQWLRDSLPILAAQCDAGNNAGINFANSIMLAIVPECPVRWEPSSAKSAEQKAGGSGEKASCTEWLRQHQARLIYDADAAVFRLAKE